LLAALPTRLRQIEPVVLRKQFVYRLTASGLLAGLEAIPARQSIQRRIFSCLLDNTEIDEAVLANLSSSWRKAMQVMLESGWISARQVLAPPKIKAQVAAAPPDLNPDQAQALHAILAQMHGFKPWLLHGITGSGKTEVYMRLILSVLAENDGQVLVLVPEINLTPQLIARFHSRLPDFQLALLHSNLGHSERLLNWRLAQSGQARIVIGTRLAVFTPLPTLRLIIVDEEHDSSYKQQEGMRYHARDIALMRAKRRDIPIVLGSATPALETWNNAITNKYGLLTLQNRAVAKAVLPNIRCINIAQGQTQDGLASTMLEALRDRLTRGEQSLLFINRRGYAPVLLCSACHWMAPCPRCSSRLVVHLRQKRLCCHHCGHEEKIPLQCPSCGNADLHPTGHGTQRLEQTLAALLPQARILRVDRDSTRRKHALSDMLTDIHAGQVDILIGTQMLAKGHDFPNLTLVGVIDTDSALFSPDFRASEHLFAQLMQVAGRAGRADKAGEVLIQTAYPDHALFNALRTQDYVAYSDALLQERKVCQFPPFAHLALLRAEANDFNRVQRFLQQAADSARRIAQNVMVYDPTRPHMQRLKNMERGQLLMQSNSRLSLQILLRNLVPELRLGEPGSKVRWSVDVDPLEF
jgi:primosomal protein N' (replication factor Y) (superfamily II helicase)